MLKQFFISPHFKIPIKGQVLIFKNASSPMALWEIKRYQNDLISLTQIKPEKNLKKKLI